MNETEREQETTSDHSFAENKHSNKRSLENERKAKSLVRTYFSDHRSLPRAIAAGLVMLGINANDVTAKDLESYNSPPTEQTQTIEVENKVEAIDYKKILGNNRVLFVGDWHSSIYIKESFKQALPELKELGITDIALEMLPKGFDIENYSAVNEYLKRDWEKGDEYFSIFTRAKDLGFKVWGIDTSDEDFISKPHEDSIIESNNQWSDVITMHLKDNPHAKIAVLNGQSHTGYFPYAKLVNTILSNRGIDSVVLQYYGGDYQEELTDQEKLMHKALLANKGNFMSKITIPNRESDYMIHIDNGNK